MNRKQLRRAICGSAVILTLGGGLLSQASVEGGFISRLWDKRPRLSESRLNPRNWFGEDEADTPVGDLKPVVSVRPELTRNPFASEAGVSGGASGGASDAAFSSGELISTASADAPAAESGAAGRQSSASQPTGTGGGSAASSGRTAMPVIAPAKTHDQTTAQAGVPAPSIDSIFKRPSADMIERARRRKQGPAVEKAAGPAVSESPAGEALAKAVSAPAEVPTRSGSDGLALAPTRKTLLKMPRPVQPTPEPVESAAGRVAIGSLADEQQNVAVGKGYVRLEDAGEAESAKSGETQTSPGQAVGQVGSAYERLLAQINGEPGGAAPTGVASRAARAPRLPDGLNVSSLVNEDAESESAGQNERAVAAASENAPEASNETVPSDAGPRSVDEMIAHSRAEMSSTFLARQADIERQAVGSTTQIDDRVDQVSVSQANAFGSGAAPLMVPQGIDPGSFRTYGEARAVADRATTPVPQAFGQDPPTFGSGATGSVSELSSSALPQTGLSRIEQAVRSAEQRTSGPAIVPGPAGSGVVIDGQQYSVVKPRVTSNAAPSLSVPDNSAFRRLSYERRADDLAGQVERLADAGATDPILITPGEPLPSTDTAAESARDNAGTQTAATVVPSSTPIAWPNEEDLAPEKPKSGGTSWGFVIFCLALLTAGTHIGVSRFRQSRMTAAAGKS